MPFFIHFHFNFFLKFMSCYASMDWTFDFLSLPLFFYIISCHFRSWGTIQSTFNHLKCCWFPPSPSFQYCKKARYFISVYDTNISRFISVSLLAWERGNRTDKLQLIGFELTIVRPISGPFKPVFTCFYAC